MNWLERMSDAIEYIEDHLTENIDYTAVAQRTYCSVYNFQRIFSFIIGIPVAEYIRNRRLTLAAQELHNSGARIIDVALKYQYESQEAFSRAFSKFHDTSPSALKEHISYPRIYPKAVIHLNREGLETISGEHFILKPAEPMQLFHKGVKGPGTLRLSVSMWSYLEFIGQNNNPQQAYTVIASLCGELYNPAVSLTSIDGIKKMLSALGFAYKVYTTNENDSSYLNRESMKKHIINHISQTQRPVIVTNELSDWCFGGVIIGYENKGDTLVNWGYFPFDDSVNPQPILTKSQQWYTAQASLIVIGERKVLPELKSIYMTGVKNAYDYLYDGADLHNAQFYQDWKRVLTQTTEETLKEVKFSHKIPCTWDMLHDNNLTDAGIQDKLIEIIDPLWCDYAERRFYAARFMQQAAEYLPQAKESLTQAKDAFDTMHNLMYEYISKVDLVAGMEYINKDKFFNSDVRKEMADIIACCELEERKAIQYLKNAIRLDIPLESGDMYMNNPRMSSFPGRLITRPGCGSPLAAGDHLAYITFQSRFYNHDDLPKDENLHLL